LVEFLLYFWAADQPSAVVRWCARARPSFDFVGARSTGAGRFVQIVFASMGNPVGDCGSYATGSCAAPTDLITASVNELCLGETTCIVPTNIPDLVEGWGGCPGVTLNTAIEMT
jgi:hypothetical protein